MTVAMEQQKKLHFELTNVGMRAQATAAGMVQLCRELHRAGILDNDALERIKSAIATISTLVRRVRCPASNIGAT